MTTESRQPNTESWETLFRNALGRSSRPVAVVAGSLGKKPKQKPLELKAEERAGESKSKERR
jgi:hypothetical protein